jgi:hypothetical protein
MCLFCQSDFAKEPTTATITLLNVIFAIFSLTIPEVVAALKLDLGTIR